MAIDRTGISSLDTGASDITYTGNQGPKSPDQQLMASADPMLVEQYQQYVFEMEEMGVAPMSFKEFVQQIMSEANMAEGGIARLGFAEGRWADPGMSPGQKHDPSPQPGGGGPPGGGDPGMKYDSRPPQLGGSGTAAQAAKFSGIPLGGQLGASSMRGPELKPGFYPSGPITGTRSLGQYPLDPSIRRRYLENQKRIQEQKYIDAINEAKEEAIGDIDFSDYVRKDEDPFGTTKDIGKFSLADMGIATSGITDTDNLYAEHKFDPDLDITLAREGEPQGSSHTRFLKRSIQKARIILDMDDKASKENKMPKESREFNQKQLLENEQKLRNKIGRTYNPFTWFKDFNEGGIARLGYRGGQLVQPGPGRPGYQGPLYAAPPSGPPGGGGGGGRRDPDPTPVQNVHQTGAVSQTPYNPVAAAVAQAEEVRNEINRIENNPRIPEQTKNELIDNIIPTVTDVYPPGYEEPVTGVDAPPGILNPPRLTADQLTEGDIGLRRLTADQLTEGDIGLQDLTGRADLLTEGDIGLQDPYKDRIQRIAEGIEPGYVEPYVNPWEETSVAGGMPGYVPTPPSDGGGDGGGLGDQGIMSTPVVAEAAGTDLAAVREAAIAEAETKSGLPFEHYYVGGDPTPEQEKFMQEHQAAASMVGRESWPAAEGGRARQRYGLGSLVKKAFKAVKKIAKSPVGMMALTGVLGGLPMFQGVGGAGAPKMSAWKKWIGPMLMGSPAGKGPGPEQSRLTGGLWNWIKGNPMKSIGLMSMLPFITQGKGEDEPSWAGNYGPGIDPEAIARKVLAGGVDPAEFRFVQPHLRAAQGGRIGYQDGRSARSVALNQLYGIMPKRKFAQEGGLMDMGGMEKDYREEGGFVPIGGQERADDVPARLSKNEFVFTADAVRAAGGGDIDAGAEVMENVMENLEQGGQVSEESQGLEGARNMFATAQRLEGVL